MSKRAKSTLSALLPQSAFARGVSVLVGGAASAQVLSVLATPLLTRLYTPADFGLLAVYVALLTLVGAVSSMRYELAIPLPDDDVEAANVAVLCVAILMIVTLASVLAVFWFGPTLTMFLRVPSLEPYLWLLPIGVCFAGGYSIFHYWGIRTKSFRSIAGARVVQSLATVLIQAIGYKFGSVALLSGQAVGQGVGLSRLGSQALKGGAFHKVSWGGVCLAASRYRHFPVYTTWAGFVNILGQQMPPLVFAAFFSPGAAGLYSMANRLLMLPASLVSGAIGQVFLAHTAKAGQRAELPASYLRVQHNLIQLGLPPAVILILVAPDLLEFALGVDWREVGVLVQWLTLGAFAGFVMSPLSTTLAILEEQAKGLILQSSLFVLRLLAIAIGVWLSDLYVAVAAFSIASFVGYGAYAMVLARLIGVSLKRLMASLFESSVFAVLAALPLGLYYAFGVGPNQVGLYVATILSACLVAARLVFVAQMRD